MKKLSVLVAAAILIGMCHFWVVRASTVEKNGVWIKYGTVIIGCGGSGTVCHWSKPEV